MDDFLSQLIAHANATSRSRLNNPASQQMAVELSSNNDERQMASLLQLCEQLNLATPLSINIISPTILVPPIIKCLQKEYNPALMLMAARALTYMCDALPQSLSVIYDDEERINALLSHLRAITDVELSEQCLACIAKLCQTPEGSLAVYMSGGVVALLAFVDFFTLASQRKVWETIAIMCANVAEDNFDKIEDTLPVMRSAIHNDDSKINTEAMTSILLAIVGVKASPSLVDRVFGDITDALIDIVTKPGSRKSNFTTVLSLILMGVRQSDAVTRRVIKSGLSNDLFDLLDAYTSSEESPAPPSQGSGEASLLASSISESQGTVKASRLTADELRVLCNLVSTLLVPYVDGASAFVNQLSQMEEGEDVTADNDGVHDDNDAAEVGEDDFEEVNENEVEEEEEVEEIDEECNESEEEARHALEDVNQKIVQEGVRLVVHREHRRCIIGAHQCDRCGKSSLQLGNWYRCNACSDVDYCATCLLTCWRAHFNGQHTFTNMRVLLHCGEDDLSAQKLDVADEAKLRMFREDPSLLLAALKGLPQMTKLCVELEASDARHNSMNYLISAIHLASKAQLRASNITTLQICDAICVALSDKVLLMQFLGVTLAKNMLEKLPEECAALLAREGAIETLQELSSRGNHDPDRHAGDVHPTSLTRRVCSLSGWKDIIAEEASALVAKLPSAGSTESSKQLQDVLTLLKQHKVPEAFTALRTALFANITSFELVSSNLIHELAATLAKENDIKLVVLLMRTLSESDSSRSQSPSPKPSSTNTASSSSGVNESSALGHLLHHLQAILTRMDKFEQQKFSFISNIHTQIPLKLIPHSVGGGHRARRGHNSTSTNETTPEGEEESTETRASGRGAASIGRAATVSVEPLATITTICTFVGNQLLSNPRSTGGRQQSHGSNEDGDSDRMEDVLPELGREASEERNAPARRSNKASARDPTVWLRMGKQVLPLSMSVLQVLQLIDEGQQHRTSRATGGASTGTHRPKVREALTLYYNDSPFGAEYEMLPLHGNMEMGSPEEDIVVVLPSKTTQPPAVLRVMERVHFTFPRSSSFLSNAQKDVLTLLGVFHEAYNSWGELLWLTDKAAVETNGNSIDSRSLSLKLTHSMFEHQKLNHKAMRQCSNLLLAGQHAKTWAVNLALDCNFLFSAATRKFLFEVSFCGTARSLTRMQDYMRQYGMIDLVADGATHTRVYRLQRLKKRVWRDKVLECAMDVINRSRCPGSVVVEFEFYGEEGSGLGPTREFYTLVAEELRKRALGLWRPSGESDKDDKFTPLNGLYPRPLEPTCAEEDRLVEYFSFLGRFIARCLLDEHIPLLALSPVLLKMLRGDNCSVHDVRSISTSLGDVLLAMIDACAHNTSTITLPGVKANHIAVTDMDLDFSLPGDDSISLIPDGNTTAVTAANMGEYCDRVVEFILKTGVERVAKAMREGFHEYIPLVALRMISVEECYERINGNERVITRAELQSHCLADHGFTLTSTPVQWFFDIIASFTVEEQRTFFHFLTGAPHLPVGGLASLTPKLTIVRKPSSEAGIKESDLLPSAMTCQNYLKLPAYDTKQQMEHKLRLAMNEGAGAFLLT